MHSVGEHGMDPALLIMDLDQVLRISEEDCNDTDALDAELSLHEVDGFGHFRHDPSREELLVKDWPPLWAVAIVDETYDDYFLHDFFGTRQEALGEARRVAKNLAQEKQTRRHLLWRKFGPSVVAKDAFGRPYDPFSQFEARLRKENVLIGPLTSPGASLFVMWHGAADLALNIAEFQNELAMENLLVFTRVLQAVPVDVRRRVASFAFTPRAMPERRALDGGKQIAFDVTSPYKSIPRFFGRWIDEVPGNATINDVARMVHQKLWSFPDEEEDEENLVLLPDFILQDTTVILCGSGSEPSLFDPRRRNISNYIEGARLFQPIADGLPTQDGVPLVRAIAIRR